MSFEKPFNNQTDKEPSGMTVVINKENNPGRKSLELVIRDSSTGNILGQGTFHDDESLKPMFPPSDVAQHLSTEALRYICNQPNNQFNIDLDTDGLKRKRDEQDYFQSVFQLTNKLEQLGKKNEDNE